MKTKEQLLSELESYLINNLLGDTLDSENKSIFIDDNLNVKLDVNSLHETTRHYKEAGASIIINSFDVACYGDDEQPVTIQKIKDYLKDEDLYLHMYINDVLRYHTPK